MSELGFSATGIEEELKASGYYASNTKGVSMEPLFRTHRDMVIIKAADGNYKKYDVVLYRVKDRYILHRIIGFKGDICLIRGDNTYSVERVPKDKILGVLVEFNRKGKKHSVEELSYKLYSRIWHYIYPVRVFYRFLVRAFKWAMRRIKRIFGRGK